MAQLVSLEEEIANKWPLMKKKNMLFHQNHGLYCRLKKPFKNTQITLRIALAFTVFTRFDSQWLSPIRRCQNKVLAKKTFGTRECFLARDESFYKKSIEMLEKDFVPLEGKKILFYFKPMCLMWERKLNEIQNNSCVRPKQR